MKFETNEAFTEACRRFVEYTAEKTASVLYGRMKPEFVSADLATRSMIMRYPVQEWELNAGGAMHGGITTAMLDSAMGSINHVLTGKLTPTIHIDVSFLRGIDVTDTVYTRVKCEKIGRNIIYISGEAWTERAPDKTAATAVGTFRNFGEVPD